MSARPAKSSTPNPLGPARILQPRRYSSEQSFAKPKTQLRNRFSNWSITKIKRLDDGIMRRMREDEDREEDEYFSIHKDGLLPPEVYEWEERSDDWPARSRNGMKAPNVASMPSISTSPSALSFPLPPIRTSQSSARYLSEDDCKTDSLLSSSTLNDPAPIPPPKKKSTPRKRHTPQASPSVAFDVPTVNRTRAISVSSAMRKAPSVNSFTAQGSFLVLPEEVDLYMSNMQNESAMDVPGLLSPSHARMGSTIPSTHATDNRAIHSHKQHAQEAVPDGQFSDVSDDGEPTAKARTEIKSLPPTPAKKTARNKHAGRPTSVESESKLPLSSSIPTQISDVFYDPEHWDVTHPAASAADAIKDWDSSTPRQSSPRKVKLKVYERVVSTRFIELSESDEEDERKGRAVTRKIVRKKVPQVTERDDPLEPICKTRQTSQGPQPTDSTSTCSSASEQEPDRRYAPPVTFSDALTQSLIHASARDHPTQQQQRGSGYETVVGRGSTDSTKPDFIDDALKTFKRRSADSNEKPLKPPKDRIHPKGGKSRPAAEEEDIEKIAGVRANPAQAKRPRRRSSFADNIKEGTVHSVRPRRPSVASSVDIYEPLGLSVTRSASRPQHRIDQPARAHQLQSMNPDRARYDTFSNADFRLPTFHDHVPTQCFGFTAPAIFSSRARERARHRNELKQLLVDPFALFDPYPPITPTIPVANDPYVYITNTAEDELLEKRGWKKVEKRWVEGERFGDWLSRRVRGEGINEARMRKAGVYKGTRAYPYVKNDGRNG